jgi:outer membrane autotransporter protein
MKGKLAAANVAAVSALALCASAYAADLRRAPPPLMQPILTWNGFYVGGHVGGVSTREDATDGFVTALPDPSGVLGGLQAGYNFQLAPNWLIGIEGELSWTSASGTDAAFPGFHSQHNWYDTFDGRLGYVMGDWLFYAKGGVAWMNADYSLPGLSVNTTRTGWNIGTGAEFMIAPQWSAKGEYNFLDFGTDNLGSPLAGIAVKTEVHEFKLGVNYHWVPGTLFGRW